MPVRTAASLELGAEQTLFALEGRYGWATFDVARDGRFLAIVIEALAAEQPITVAAGPARRFALVGLRDLEGVELRDHVLG